MSKLSVRVEIFKPWRSNTLRGFVDIVVPELHLRIFDASVHQGNGKRWVGLPAKPMVVAGEVRRDERGRVAYSPVMEFLDKPTRDAFSQRAVAALLETFPDAFSDEVVS